MQTAAATAPRNRLWKVELQKLADETGLEIEVSHYPPGTNKWNKIEHRLFCHVTRNWRGQPLLTHEVVVSLIGVDDDAVGFESVCEVGCEPV